MSWTPISNCVPQYSKNAGGAAASGYYLKFYADGTSTPINMATDSTGGTTLAKCQLDSLGYPINGSGDIFIPHIDQEYKLALYENETDADNNTLASATWVVDNIIQQATATNIIKTFAVLNDAVTDANLSDGDVVEVKERTAGNNGGGTWDVVLSSTVTENAYTIVQCTGVATLSLVLRKDKGAVDFIAAGGDPTGGSYVNDAWKYAMELFSDGKGGTLIIPSGTFLVEPTYRQAGDLDKQLDYPYDNVTVELTGDLQVDTHSAQYICVLFGRRRGSTSTTENRVRNIRLTGTGRIIGDRDTHTTSDTNYGFGIYIANCEDSQIDGNLTIQDVYGDGYYIDALPYGPADGDNNNDSTCVNVNVFGTVARNNYRNNVSILNNKGIDFWGTVADRANGGAPQAGFDVEPDFYQVSGDYICESIGLHGVKAINNAGSGIEIVDTSAGRIDSVIIDSPYVKNNGGASNGFGGIRVVSNDGLGSVNIISPEVLDCYGLGIDIDGAGSGSTASARRIKVVAPFIKGILEGTKEGTTLGHGIGVRNGVRGVDIISPTVELCDRQGIYINGAGDGSTAAAGVSDIVVTAPSVYANSQATNNTYDNILINTGCQNINVHGGIVRSAHPTETTTNNPRYGVNILSDECHLLDTDIASSGSTANFNTASEKILDGISGRNGIIRALNGYKNSATIRSGVQNVDATGTFSIALAHGLDTIALATASLRDEIASQVRLTMIDEGTLAGNPVVVPRVTSIDATNVNIDFTVVTAGTAGDQMRVAVYIQAPAM